MIGPVYLTDSGTKWDNRCDFSGLGKWVAPHAGSAIVITRCTPPKPIGDILYVAGHHSYTQDDSLRSHIVGLCDICVVKSSSTLYLVADNWIRSCSECHKSVMKIDVTVTTKQKIICYSGDFLMYSNGFHGFETYFNKSIYNWPDIIGCDDWFELRAKVYYLAEHTIKYWAIREHFTTNGIPTDILYLIVLFL